jgi:hypothetical protein
LACRCIALQFKYMKTKKSIALALIFSLLLLGSCKKDENIYSFFIGDWNLAQVNNNGVITNNAPQAYDWAVYGCSGDPGGWCNSSVIYTFPAPGNYSLAYQFSSDNKWLITLAGSTIDSLQILTFTNDTLVTLLLQPGVVEKDTWVRE